MNRWIFHKKMYSHFELFPDNKMALIVSKSFVMDDKNPLIQWLKMT